MEQKYRHQGNEDGDGIKLYKTRVKGYQKEFVELFSINEAGEQVVAKDLGPGDRAEQEQERDLDQAE